MFILFIGGTDVSKQPGLSAAGANIDVLPYTSPADADMVWWGRPKIIDVVPVDPQGHPTPAIITRAAREEANFPFLVVRAGSYLAPVCPYMELGIAPGRDMRSSQAVEDADKIFEECRCLAKQFPKSDEPCVIAESVPGGTTTALMVLRALGYSGMVSCAAPDNPVSSKEQIWLDVKARLGVSEGGFAGKGMAAVREMGDPMQAAVAGFIAGLDKDAKLVLAGGTQMLAVAAAARHSGVGRELLIATTKYVAEDKTADFNKIAAELELKTWAAQLDFSNSPHKGLSDYEKGYVKEGVGAGGAVWYAEQKGITAKQVCARVEKLYQNMMGL